MSTVPAAQAALVDVLTAAVPDDVQVLRGALAAVTVTADRWVLVGGAVGRRTFRALNGIRIGEQYEIAVVISCSIPGPDAMGDSAAAADALWSALDDAVLATPGGIDLGLGDGVQARALEDFRVEHTATDSDRNTTITLAVQVTASS